jgi:deoxycytidylate deaminase
MKLQEFYSLRKDFTIIGLTGRVGSGCSQTAKFLSDPYFIKNLGYCPLKRSLVPEEIKFDICYNYLNYEGNWNHFQIINYKDVLLLHILFEAADYNKIEDIIQIIVQFGESDEYITPRFNPVDDIEMIKEMSSFLKTNESIINHHIFNEKGFNLIECLKSKNSDFKKEFIQFYFEEFTAFSSEFHNILNRHNTSKRSLFNHDIANNLRSCGTTRYCVPTEENQYCIYTIAETINQLIKCWRTCNNKKSKIVIDALKNSLELMYFKEKFSGFYMVAINKNEEDREKYVRSKIAKNSDADLILDLDATEYKGDEFSDGKFSSPDIENCIQKSDYHIFHSEDSDINNHNKEKNLSYQLVKLLALIGQPGIITPTAIERTMQIAYNAKFNSGCISRQVGAVVTDQNFIVKSIGWNDVAKDQMPCKLRDIRDLASEEPHEIFSEYEISGSVTDSETKITSSFNDLVKKEVESSKITDKNLQGRHCSFCFKGLQNAFERQKNQVHTRSLHAEENAMMQISKKGGNGLEAGKLFTTASPCELCSKKAFQLGVTEIYYIDPYPGIAMKHTLKNGVRRGDKNPNPTMIMFRGAVGRAFHKLYEPFMSYKDEIGILTGLKPKSKRLSNDELIQKMELSDEMKDSIKDLISKKTNLPKSH